jgi:hypothetical protein
MRALSPERRIARFPRFGVLAGRALLSVLLVLGLLLAVADGLQDVPVGVGNPDPIMPRRRGTRG